MKKYILGLIIAWSVPFVAFAATPQLIATATGDGNNVLVTVTNADGNSPVALYFRSNTDGVTRSQIIGTTNTSGSFSGSVNTNSFGINSTTPVYAMINGYTSNNLTWPYNGTGASSQTQSQIVFSQNNPYVANGQSGSLTLTGGTGNYYISSNSNNGVISAAISGNTLSYSGLTNGSSVITVCSVSGGLCSSTTISTNFNNQTTNGGLSISPTSLVLAPGQSGLFTVSGGNAPYTVTTVNGENLTYFANGNSISLSGLVAGTRLLNVCSSNNICSQVNVNVSTTAVGTSQTPDIKFTISLGVNETVRMNLIGGNGSTYYLQTPISSPVIAGVNGSTLTVTGTSLGSTGINICQNGNTICLPITFVVNQMGSSNNGTGGPYTFTTDVWYGQTSAEVTELQKYLIGENYLSAEATGYFGDLTLDAVQRFQTAHGVPSTGYVGALTRAALNNN